jgi:hypothetical protein
MSPKHKKRKRLAFVLCGAFLFVICGLLVWMGYLFSRGLAYASPTDYLKFIFHPTTLLFFLSFWLLYRGITMRDQ